MLQRGAAKRLLETAGAAFTPFAQRHIMLRWSPQWVAGPASVKTPAGAKVPKWGEPVLQGKPDKAHHKESWHFVVPALGGEELVSLQRRTRSPRWGRMRQRAAAAAAAPRRRGEQRQEQRRAQLRERPQGRARGRARWWARARRPKSFVNCAHTGTKTCGRYGYEAKLCGYALLTVPCPRAPTHSQGDG